MTNQAIQPIALYRLEDAVIFWQDTPEGWTHVNMFGEHPSDGRRMMAELILEFAPEFPDPKYSVIVCGMDAVRGLPADMPSYGLVGIHPSFFQDGVPEWKSGEPDPRGRVSE